MRYTGIQPQYFPRLHYFARVLNTDVFMIRDDVQFVRKHKYPDGKNGKSYQAHTPIKQASGTQLLSVPIKHAEERFLPIYKTEILQDNPWNKDQLLTIKMAYSRSKNFSLYFPMIEKLLQLKKTYISDLNIASLLWGILVLLGEEVTEKTLTVDYVNSILKDQGVFRLKTMRRGSESIMFKSGKNLSANEKIIALCTEVGATEDYCGGTGVAAYVDTKLFKDHGIIIKVQDWKCSEYPQSFTSQQGFIPNLSIIDLLMNVSRTDAAAILNE